MTTIIEEFNSITFLVAFFILTAWAVILNRWYRRRVAEQCYR